MYEKNVGVGQTLEVDYNVSNDIGDVSTVLNIDITDNSNSNNTTKESLETEINTVKKFQWTPTKDDMGGEYIFEINGDELLVKVYGIPDSTIARYVAEDYDESSGMWADKQMGNNVEKNGNPLLVNNVINSNSVVRFDKDDYFTLNSVLSNSSTLSGFVVIGNLSDNSGYNTNFRQIYAQDNKFNLSYNGANTDYNFGSSAGSYDNINFNVSRSEFRIISLITNSDDILLRENGKTLYSTSSGTNNTNNTFNIGYDNNPEDRYFNGDMAELIITDGETRQERNEIESYLSSYYNIPLQ